ncbi:MAG TPA: hypothetical protein DD001_22075 [Microcoleaceae bacterium UBA10368]|nr:hypothetical protein [Microcoleaceae cyanobacterium UBA10368]HCV32486.1 hypothetical protein [Microcoleaceae cyanobacterium UBA9251]
MQSFCVDFYTILCYLVTNTAIAIENQKSFSRETNTFNRVWADLVLKLSVQNRYFPKVPTECNEL